MRYLIALLIPPLGLLVCGRPFQALLNLVLIIVAILFGLSVIGMWIGFWITGATALHAVLIAHNTYADERQTRLERLLAPVAPVPATNTTDQPAPVAPSADWVELYGAEKKSWLSWLR